MKKLILLLFTGCLISFSGAAQQISNHAIGVRLGGEDGIGAEISYQRALGGNNRLELDLGFADRRGYDAFKFTALYHWVYNIQGGFNWFAGVGGGIGYAEYDFGDPFYRNRDFDDDDERIFASIDGSFGIEYSFLELGAPIQLALDLNPELEFFGGDYYYDDGVDFDLDLGFAIRYQF